MGRIIGYVVDVWQNLDCKYTFLWGGGRCCLNVGKRMVVGEGCGNDMRDKGWSFPQPFND